MKDNRGNRVAFLTLGCKLNYSETSSIARQFIEHGYEKVSAAQEADIYVINTCSVTEHADKKCRNAIRKLHKQNPAAIVAVTGCYAQLKPQEILSIEGVDLVLGADQKENLFMRVSNIKERGEEKHTPKAFSCEISHIETIFPAYSSDDRTRSFLKVQDGCDYNCSYCTIPLARGKSRNHPIDFLVGEATEIALRGIKEIVLTGVNTGDFGKTTNEDFLELLKRLEEVEGIERYRISSIEPNLITPEIIDWIAQGRKFLPHFHIPLQCGSDKILALMKRRYNTKLFEERISLIREKIPYAFLGIDVIVGFPGEDEDEFDKTYRFLEKISPSFLHVFPYSKRANTPAAEYSEQVEESEKHQRVARLTQLSNSLYDKFVEQNRGRREKVLYESTKKGGKMFGYTGNYIKIEVPYDKSLIGKVCDIII
ncbi:MAG: tRNA (N(6)-L-threonylcarbamoyladenosine(37)-C(2))-methylthiotransferase MtaB [Bacteroidales bacterium]|nr:tRNA (N(6)-L-threonylcarbamoyladenosine(37)-C(2))-methylthiotransferase MtaB [Bacteroidales bacterium]MDD4057470.1 tRNA (N(6)-L-threonylcarbamoyladenosine(37)-C(2))-methylthiotransferase MtaB [Bacteroidales bacterium]